MECPTVFITSNTECGVSNPNPVKVVIFDPETGKVYDKEERNFIGYGVLKGDRLLITQELSPPE